MPSGRKHGNECASCCFDSSRFVTGNAAVPPAALMRCIGPASSENRMTPSRFHDAPVGVASAPVERVCGGPPPTGTFLMLPPGTKKPMWRLSGDQKGYRAPSVPAISRASSPSLARSHNLGSPASFAAANARYFPSGENATKFPAGVKVTTPGGIIVNFTGVPSLTPLPPLRFSARVEATSSATVAIARSTHGSHPRTPSRDTARRRACRVAGVSACGDARLSSISIRASAMSCSRRRGSLVRQRRSRCSMRLGRSAGNAFQSGS